MSIPRAYVSLKSLVEHWVKHYRSRMRRGWPIIIASMVVLLGLCPPSSAAGTVKSGTACKQIGSVRWSGKTTWVCGRINGKLVWQRMVAKKALPTPSAMPSPQALDAVALTVEALRQQAAVSAGSMPVIEFVFQGATSTEIESKTKRSLEKALPVFQGFGFNTTPATVLAVRDSEWMFNQITQRGCRSGPFPTRPGFYVGNCNNGSGVITSSHWDVEKFSDGLDGLYFNHTIPHEYFHHIQEQLVKPGFGNADFPKWFWEGSAQFFTNQAWSTWNSQRPYTAWFDHWWNKLRPDLGPVACTGATAQEMSDIATTGIDGICPYSKGQLMVELLVSEYGLDKYRRLYTENRTPGWKNFHQIFKVVIGRELADFYVDAEAFMKQRGW